MTRKEFMDYADSIAVNPRYDGIFVFYKMGRMAKEVYDFYTRSENIELLKLIRIAKKDCIKIFYFDLVGFNETMILLNQLFSREGILIPFEIISKFKEYYLLCEKYYA